MQYHKQSRAYWAAVVDEADGVGMGQAQATSWVDDPELPPSGSVEERRLFLAKESVKAAVSTQ